MCELYCFEPYNFFLIASASFVSHQINGSEAMTSNRLESVLLQYLHRNAAYWIGHDTVITSVMTECPASSRGRFDKQMSALWSVVVWVFCQVQLYPPSCLVNPSMSILHHSKDTMILTPGPDWLWPGGLQSVGRILCVSASLTHMEMTHKEKPAKNNHMENHQLSLQQHSERHPCDLGSLEERYMNFCVCVYEKEREKEALQWSIHRCPWPLTCL